MEDAIPGTGQAGSNIAEYTVSEISGALKRSVEEQFGHVRVRGEVSGYRGPHSSGHCYFALKDERARLDAVIWRSAFSRLKIQPEEGMEVVASGRLSTYPGRSTYQIIIDTIEPAGAGALMALLEQRKRKLAEEGLFAEARKRALPYMPRVIGVVTSPTGSVIRDILHRIHDRFPLTVVVWPVRVQGETAGPEATAAIEGFNALAAGGRIARPDVIILARGGGSLEDLWGFNDEALVRAVAGSEIPVISAIGHETDWTLVDLAADMRAPTPTGAAEIAVPVKAELEAEAARLGARLKAAASRGLDRQRQAVRALARALPSADQLLALPRRRFDETAARLGRALTANNQRKRIRYSGVRLGPEILERVVRGQRGKLDTVTARMRIVPIRERLAARRGRIGDLLARADRRLETLIDRRRNLITERARMLSSLAYPAVLARGYVIVSDSSGNTMTRAAAVAPGSALTLTFSDGEVEATAKGRRAAGQEKKPSVTKGRQGSLF